FVQEMCKIRDEEIESVWREIEGSMAQLPYDCKSNAKKKSDHLAVATAAKTMPPPFGIDKSPTTIDSSILDKTTTEI
ncbi:unnamed protein product, partial [Didymodactylos carnosus]